MTPFQAATHPDPYGYYQQLRQHSELWFDPGLGLWIASSARAVEAIAAHPDCLVRPPGEPVPCAIAHGSAGQVFGDLMRMNEGERHRCPRRVIAPVLASIGAASIAHSVMRLFDSPGDPFEELNALIFTLPVSVVADLLGFACGQLQEVAERTRDFVACLSPLSDEAQLHAADVAAVRLGDLFNGLLCSEGKERGVLDHIYSQHQSGDWPDRDALIANVIGLLSQTCEASAGLIGNTLVALQQQPGLLQSVRQAPQRAVELVAEVARHDSPVQNTRRFVAARCTVGDRVLAAGDTVLLLLASANRDPWANPDPDSFQLDRPARRTFSFGYARHECPGQQLALSIASHAIQALLRRQPAFSADTLQWRYLPSLNGRIPRFYHQEHTQ